MLIRILHSLIVLPGLGSACNLDRNSLAEPFQFYNWGKFRVFLLLDWLPSQEKMPILSNYSPITEGRTVGFMPFSRVLVLGEMQTI